MKFFPDNIPSLVKSQSWLAGPGSCYFSFASFYSFPGASGSTWESHQRLDILYSTPLLFSMSFLNLAAACGLLFPLIPKGMMASESKCCNSQEPLRWWTSLQKALYNCGPFAGVTKMLGEGKIGRFPSLSHAVKKNWPRNLKYFSLSGIWELLMPACGPMKKINWIKPKQFRLICD